MNKIVKSLIIFGLAMGIIYFGKWFIQTEYFKIREISIDGENTLVKKNIVDKLEKMKGRNIVYIDAKKIEKEIKKDVRVKNVSIQKIFPDKLKINLEERKPRVYIQKGEDRFLADEDLVLYGYMSEEKLRNIPTVAYTDEESLKDLKIIISKIQNKDLYDIISEIRKSDKSYELILMETKIKLVTDTLVSEERYNEAYKFYEKIKNDQAIEYIDIRFKYFNVK